MRHLHQALAVLSAILVLCSCQLVRKKSVSQKLRSLPSKEVCGIIRVPEDTSGKIIGGKPAKLGIYPWMAAIAYIKPGSSIRYYSCGGSLITNQYVITAAHCVIKELTGDYQVDSVRLGDLDLDDLVNDGASPKDFEVEKITVHEQYDNTRKVNDIALIKLKRKVQFTDHIIPICLPPPDFSKNLYVGYSPTIAGWGKSVSDSNVRTETKLLEAEVDIKDTESCRINVTSKLPRVVIDNKVICAASQSDSCQGDSGGPLMFHHKTKNAPVESKGNMYLMGIVSFGYLCAEPGYPGVYTRVSEQMGWIMENLEI